MPALNKTRIPNPNSTIALTVVAMELLSRHLKIEAAKRAEIDGLKPCSWW
jgi:hypothetical protein